MRSSKSYKQALRDMAYLAFRHKIFNTEWYDDKEKFQKSAWYSIHPTLEESGIKFKYGLKSIPADLNVEPGDRALVTCEGQNNGRIVQVVKYAGIDPYWKGVKFCEGDGPCWIVKVLGEPIEFEVSDEMRTETTLPCPDARLTAIPQ